MISTEELRDKVATLGSNYLTDKEWIEVIDRLEVAEKSDAESLMMYRKARDERDALRSLVVMRFDHEHPPQFVQGYDPHDLLEPVTAEQCRWFVAEIERLRAKIERMEKQEPVAKVRIHKAGGNAGLAWSVAPLNDFDSLPLMRDGDRFYAIPGAKGEEK